MAASSSWRRGASLGSLVPRCRAADVAVNTFSGSGIMRDGRISAAFDPWYGSTASSYLQSSSVVVVIRHITGVAGLFSDVCFVHFEGDFPQFAGAFRSDFPGLLGGVL